MPVTAAIHSDSCSSVLHCPSDNTLQANAVSSIQQAATEWANWGLAVNETLDGAMEVGPPETTNVTDCAISGHAACGARNKSRHTDRSKPNDGRYLHSLCISSEPFRSPCLPALMPACFDACLPAFFPACLPCLCGFVHAADCGVGSGALGLYRANRQSSEADFN